MNKYRPFKVKRFTFLFAREENPVTKEIGYHIWFRHLVKPQQAIKAFFSAENVTYNQKYERYEAYSSTQNMTIYYFYPDNTKKDLIIVISAFVE